MNGCLNDFCCESVLYFVKGKYDYLIYFAFLSSVLGIINYTTLVSLMTFLSLYTVKRLAHNLQEKFMGIMILIVTVVTIVYLIFGVQPGPTMMPFIHATQFKGL
jgi:hypothetical protein